MFPLLQHWRSCWSSPHIAISSSSSNNTSQQPPCTPAAALIADTSRGRRGAPPSSCGTLQQPGWRAPAHPAASCAGPRPCATPSPPAAHPPPPAQGDAHEALQSQDGYLSKQGCTWKSRSTLSLLAQLHELMQVGLSGFCRPAKGLEDCDA